MTEKIDEVRNLQACLNNLISLLALPAMWTGGDREQIATVLLDVLLDMLQLDFVYVRLKNAPDVEPLEMVRSAPSANPVDQTTLINRLLATSAICGTHTRPLVASSIGNVSTVAYRLGLNEGMGVLVAGCRRTDFPDANERLLLNVAANQAALGLQEAESRKRPEQALLRSQFYLAEGQRLTHTGSWSFIPSGFYDYWSEELFRIYGLDPAAGPPTLEKYLACVHPQDRDFMACTIRRMLAEGLGCDLKKRIVRPDGEIRHIRCVGVPIIEQSALKQIIGTAMDVTDQEQLTQELQRREAYLAKAQRLSQTGSFGWKPGSGEIVWSEETHRIFEIDSATKPSVEMVILRAHPEDRDAIQQVIDRATREAADLDLEHRLVMPNGTLKHLHVVGHSVCDETTGETEYVGAVMDVTRNKQAEERIRQNERELRHLIDFLPQHIFVLDSAGRLVQANQMALEYTARTLAELRDLGMEERFEKDIHPDDLERAQSERQAGLSGGTAFEVESRVLGKDGQYRWFLYRYKPMLDEAGHVTHWFVSGTDINDRKHEEEGIRKENIALREEVVNASMFEELVGTSSALKAVLSRVAKVARTDSTVLITGETGTGKELVARAIHKLSQRVSRAFVSVNCAAIPRDLIASELFGHEKGAFTGAWQRRLGRFELAEGGTIFIDEVGELLPETQIALLRVLQEREFERVGGTRSMSADVRVIAATNRDLRAAIASGSFRKDLFYRLNVFPIEVPPLRERTEDIPLLVEYLIDRYARRTGRKIKVIPERTLNMLQRYSWPGNIRELQNILERSVIISENESLTVDKSWFSSEPVPSQRSAQRLGRLPVVEETKIIEQALSECRGRVAGELGAAARLGVPASTLESKIRALGINKYAFKAN